MQDREILIQTAISAVSRAAELLSAADEGRALSHLRQALAILNSDAARMSAQPDNTAAVSLLRMALALLDQKGEVRAACDVDSALAKLGADIGPPLSESEAVALLNRRMERTRSR